MPCHLSFQQKQPSYYSNETVNSLLIRKVSYKIYLFHPPWLEITHTFHWMIYYNWIQDIVLEMQVIRVWVSAHIFLLILPDRSTPLCSTEIKYIINKERNKLRGTCIVLYCIVLCLYHRKRSNLQNTLLKDFYEWAYFFPLTWLVDWYHFYLAWER